MVEISGVEQHGRSGLPKHQPADLGDVRLGVVAGQRDDRNAPLVAEPVDQLGGHAAFLDSEHHGPGLTFGAVAPIVHGQVGEDVTGTCP